MAAKNVFVDEALAELDRQINELVRAKELVVSASARVGEVVAEKPPRKPRGPNKRKPGLPAQTDAVQ